jgi:hypothetical protein
VGNVSYIGVSGKNGGGQNSELEEHKVEALRLQNELTRVRLEKLRGDVVDLREIQFVFSNTLTILREQILRLPQIVLTEVHSLSPVELHNVRMSLERRVDQFLLELADNLQKGVNPSAYLAELMSDDEKSEEQKAADVRKKAQANAKRREKRQARQRKP